MEYSNQPMQIKMEQSTLTDYQLEIFHQLYKFRFVNTNQFQKLFNHGNPTTVQKWLQQLRKEGYIDYRDFSRKKFINNTKPAIYYLTKIARKKLKKDKKYLMSVLNLVYENKDRSEQFVNNHIFMTNLYLSLLAQEGKDKLKFFTQYQLKEYTHFPQPLPFAYVVIKGASKTKRYFIFLFEETTPWFIIEKRLEKYLKYVGDKIWADYSQDPLPTFLFICKNNMVKEKIYKKISDSYSNEKFYVATKQELRQSGFKGAWKEIE